MKQLKHPFLLVAIIGIIVITSCAQPGTPETWVPVTALSQLTGTWTGSHTITAPTSESESITISQAMTMKYPDRYNGTLYFSQMMLIDFTPW